MNTLQSFCGHHSYIVVIKATFMQTSRCPNANALYRRRKSKWIGFSLDVEANFFINLKTHMYISHHLQFSI